MKKVIFSIFLMIGLVFGVSEVMAQSVGPATLVKTDGTVNTVQVVMDGLMDAMAPLTAELQVATDEVDIKLLTLEILLYRKMHNDLQQGALVRNAYNDNINWFLQDYSNQFFDRKVEAVDAFHEIVFVN